MDQKMIEKAKSAAELAKMAHEQGIMLSDSDAEGYYAQFHQEEKELSNDELNNVSGGGCYSKETLAKSYRQVTPDGTCSRFQVSLVGDRSHRCCKNCTHSTTAKGTEIYFCVS